MNAIRRHPFFTVWIVGCVVLLAAGLGWGLRLRKNVRHELAGVEKKILLRTQLAKEIKQADPAPGDSPTEPPAPAIIPRKEEPVPRKPLDGFIEITGVVESLRQLATTHEVSLLPDETFGFASYAHQGPPENELAAVHRQIGLTRLLVGKLFAAHPDKLLAVRRERDRSNGREVPGEVLADYFQMDGRLDLRATGEIEGGMIRLEFTGRTPVLRIFLQSLAEAPEPLVVRSVEVEPLPAGGDQQGTRSKMSVVVVEAKPIGARAKPGNENNRPDIADLWKGPSIGPAGEERGYALFDPPSPRRGERERPSRGIPQSGPGENPAIELLAVKREPYRLQLVGYYGVPGDYTAAFVSAGSPETLLARVGHRFESLGLVLKNFSVRKSAAENTGGQSGFELTATALLWDEQKQVPVTLVDSERLLTDTPLAILRLNPLPARPTAFRAGDSFQAGATRCRIEHIQLDPAEVVIVRESAGGPDPERLILKPSVPAPAPHSSLSLGP